ncbi:MAG: glycosyltransferase family 4 protein [Candidatus Margulisbacteria bacterium]|nr:glycosyltransferase family 4 protein [Candidatus Margulisiibacteriota bacterium]
MHIVIEADQLNSPKYVGISNYVSQYIHHLSQANHLISVFHKNKKKLFNKYTNVFEPSLNKFPPANQPPQILHSFTLARPKNKTLPWIQTIFDTIIEHHPQVLQEIFPKINSKTAHLIQRTVKVLAQQPQIIIAPSENTKKDLIAIYKIPEKKIKVIPLAPQPIFHLVSTLNKNKFLKNKNISFPFFLFVGQRWKYKNFLTLLKAFTIYKKRVPLEGQSLKLIAVGSPSYFSPEEEIIINKNNLHNEVIIFPQVTQKDLNLFYNTAYALIYPSLYEGFGLPPLEAMSCELPVIASNSSSIPEVTGEAALLFNPEHAEQLAEIMQKILYDKPLYEKLILKGKNQIKKFNWGKITKDTIKIYEQLLPK